MFYFIIKFLSMKLFFPLVLINQNFMKDNLNLYDIIFIKYYNVNSIINVFDGYGLNYHYFQYVLTISLLSC
jgi:hypothetical protein